jgi:glycosyltransferase involved in cell wall biosynthesis
MLKICIEGWRGINHSYSIINQNQLIELSKLPIDLRFRDVSFPDKNWNNNKNADGFSKDDKRIVNQIQKAKTDEIFDVIYRISYPFDLAKTKSKKHFVQITSERNTKLNIINGSPSDLSNRQYLKIITPSIWSKNGLIKTGFDENQIIIIPHGVNNKIFRKISENELNNLKLKLNIKKDDFVLTNVSAMTGNKGIHFLITAYAILKQKLKNLKLILKDQSGLYNIKAQTYIKTIQDTKYSKFMTDDVLKDIIFISENLDLKTLNQLYNLSNCYVSPYKSEGFNLPPLEAAAAGTPIIVTKGGSTDDYFTSEIGLQVESNLIETEDKRFLEPNLDSLIDCITEVYNNTKNFGQIEGSKMIQNNYSWTKITRKLYEAIK